VVTVRNDREGLRGLLPGLAAQTLKPDELVIVDGGSVDGTLDALRGFRMLDTPIRTTVAPGANIAAGRNIGIGLARNELIACTDAGCRPDPGWLAALRQGLDRADIVGGVFVAEGRSDLEKILSLTYYPVPYELDRPGLFVRLSHRFFGRRYLASLAGARSMAFHRSVWRAVGGFPEIQYAGEDQAFTRAVVDAGYKATFARKAVVRWRPRGTHRANARMFYRYSRGDIRSKGRSRHVARLAAWSVGPTALVRGKWGTRTLIFAGAIAYVALPMQRARLAGLAPRSWWQIPIAVTVKDLSQIAGAAAGSLDALRGVPQPNPQPPPKLEP
jgi:glycosyltransferase involved in cell wall biosynthesis